MSALRTALLIILCMFVLALIVGCGGDFRPSAQKMDDSESEPDKWGVVCYRYPGHGLSCVQVTEPRRPTL